MAISKVRNPIFTFPTKMVRSNFAEAKKELRWKPMAEYRKQAYAEIPVKVFYNKVNGTALCTGCGFHFLAEPSFKHNGTIKCPKCKKEAVLQNNRLFKNHSTFFWRVEADYLQRGTNGSLCRCDTMFSQEVVFDESMNATLVRREHPLSCTVIRNNGVRVRMTMFDEWQLNNKDNFITRPMCGWWEPLNYISVKLTVLKKVVMGTEFEKFFDCVPEHLKTSDGLMCVVPQVEKLFKVGLYSLGERYLQEIFHKAQSRSRWIEIGIADEPVAKMLGLNRKTVSLMTKLDPKNLTIFHICEKHNLPIESTYRQFEKDDWTLSRLEAFCEDWHLNLKRVLAIFENDPSDIISDYKDYITALKEYGDYPNDKRYLYPVREEFIRLHDEMTAKAARERELAEARDRETEEMLIKEYAKYLMRFAFEDAAYLVRPLNSIEDMLAESRLMSHCVKTYVTKYSSKKCALFTMREVSNPNHPIATIELRKHDKEWKIIQMRGKHNVVLPDQVANWLKTWLDNVLNKPQVKKTRKVKVA